MELQHRLVRQTINIAISKAIDDMRCNLKRSMRNLVDLGLLFSKSEKQKWFFSTAKKVISNRNNPYYPLISRVLADVDTETIKRVGLNLGYSSLIYGAHKIKKKRESMNYAIPWLLIFDIAESGPDYFHQLEKLLSEGRELGVYSYIFCIHQESDLFTLCEIAEQFDECFFAFELPSHLIIDKTAHSLGKIHNVVISVHSVNDDLNSEYTTHAFRVLKQNHCLYGYHLYYNEDNIGKVISPEYVSTAIELGSVFGVYIAADGVPAAYKEAAYHFVCQERGENGQPLIALDWFRDMEDISKMILSKDGYIPKNPIHKVRNEYIKAKESLTNSFPNLFQILKPTASPNS
ncbi:hypothetical protein [Desulfitobacterium sp.]|uniref:hypothetical protein n=1 Tax=Desulfitobacterium sp. TaxID=49981 RepID=UPI002B1FFEB3|nr:hypothetical protein [Desulfitobacterium sp.]MEA4901753.1 hypothetical protein [Desulfitobacterium sp.]